MNCFPTMKSSIGRYRFFLSPLFMIMLLVSFSLISAGSLAAAETIAIKNPSTGSATNASLIAVNGIVSSDVSSGDSVLLKNNTTTSDSVAVESDSSWQASSFTLDNGANTVVANLKDTNSASPTVDQDTIMITLDESSPSDTFNLLNPSNGIDTSNRSINFDWEDASDTRSGIQDYFIQISTDTNFESTDIVREEFTGNSETTITLNSDTVYFWRVYARDDAGNTSGYTGADTFRIDASGPGLPTLQSPINGSGTNVSSVTFDWTDSKDTGVGVQDYFIEVSKLSTFATTERSGFTSNSISDTNYTFNTDDIYYWRVYARDDLGNTSGFTESDTFLFDQSPPSDTFLSPLDGDTVNQTMALMVEANDTVSPISEVRFWEGSVGSTLINTAVSADENGLWTVSWNSNSVSDGSQQITAEVENKANVTSTETIGLLVDNDDPDGVSITSHSDGEIVEDTITITASASDPGGAMNRVEFYYGLFPNPVSVDERIEVDFDESFSGTPRVVSMINNADDNEVLAQEVNVSSSSFELYICGEGSGQDDCGESDNRFDSPPYKVSWVAIEPGNNPFNNSNIGQTGGIGSSTWNSQSFSGFSTVPAAVSTIVTNNGGQQQKPTMSRFVSSGGMEIRYCEHDSPNSCDNHLGEDVDWFAFEPGIITGAGSGVAEAGITRVPGDRTWRNVRLSQSYSNPIILANSNTDTGGSSESGGNTGEQPKVAQVREVVHGEKDFEVRLCEHSTNSGCDPGHPAQKVGWTAFDLNDLDSVSGIDGGILNSLGVDTTSASWSVTVNTNKIQDGVKDIHVEAYDRAGNLKRLLDPVSLIVDRSPPSDTFDLLVPSDHEETNASNPIRFNWETAGDTLTSVQDYFIEVSTDPGFNTVDRSGTTTNTDTSFNLPGDTVYYWRVTAFDTLNNAQTNGPDSFVVDRTRPTLDTFSLSVTDDTSVVPYKNLDGDSRLLDNILHEYKVNITDSFLMDEVTLYLRNDGTLADTTDTSFKFGKTPGTDTWQVKVPQTNFDDGNIINFIITGEDSATNTVIADSEGNGFRYQVVDTFPNIPPKINLKNPLSGDTFGRTVSGTYVISDSQDISADVDIEYSTDSGVTWSEATVSGDINNVSVSIDGDTHSFTWNSLADLGEGFYDTEVKLRIRGYDQEDTGTFDTSPAFLVDQLKPGNLSFLHPSAGEIIDDTTTLVADAEDTGPGEVARITFYESSLDPSNQIGFDNDGSDSWTNPWNTNELSDGNQDAFFVARDEFGNTDSVSVTAEADNTNPGPLNITTPSDGDFLNDTVIIEMNNNGGESLNRVEFHRNRYKDTVVINFRENFTNPPVVISQVQNNNGREYSAQVREVTSDSATIYLCGSGGCGIFSGVHEIGWIAQESGRLPFLLGPGEVGLATGLQSNNWGNVTFGVNFNDNPIGATSLNTDNDPGQPKPPEGRNISISDMDVQFCHYGSGNGCDSTSNAEDIGWMAIDPGPFGPGAGFSGSVNRNGNNWGSPIQVSRIYNDPIVIAGHNDNNGSEQARTDQVRNVKSGSFEVRQCEYEDDSGCDGHATNPIGWMMFELSEISDLSDVDGGLISLIGEDQTSPYSITWDTTSDTDGKHDVFVKGFDDAGNPDTDIVTVTVDNTPPDTPTLLDPENGISTNVTSIDFDWESADTVSGIQDHFIEVSRDTFFTDVTDSGFTSGPGSDTTIRLLSDTVFYWRVFTRDQAGNTSGFSPADTFILDRTGPVDTFSLQKPSNGSETRAETLQFDWETSFDTLSGLNRYRIQVATDTAFAVPDLVTDSFTGNSETEFTVPKPDTTYFWRVYAEDNSTNTTAWSSTDTFLVDRTPPPKTTLNKPQDGSETKSLSIQFDWTDVSDTLSGTKNYRIQIDSGLTVTVDDGVFFEGDTTSSDTVVTFDTENNYVWRVFVRDEAGNTSGYSAINTFSIDRTPPPRITNLSSTATVNPPDTGVNLFWSLSSSDIDEYRIYRSFRTTDSSTANRLDTTSYVPDTVTYRDSTVTKGDSFFYYVTAVDTAQNESDSSNITGAAHISFKKTQDDTASHRPGDKIVYTIEYVNDGFAPSDNLIIVDAIPDSVTLSDTAEVVSGPSATVEYFNSNTGTWKTSSFPRKSVTRIRWSINSILDPKATGSHGILRFRSIFD